MTYVETINYLFTHLPMYQRIGAAAYKADLTNTLALAKALGDPHKQLTTIHVAGTNGKGSVSNMLASVLMEAGYSTGLYTSPHLLDFRERIRVNGQLCSEEFVVDFVNKMKPHIERIQPSFFEITVVMALDYFVQQKTDIAIIEVGLGGRLDSTNIITPAISVITNISFDHQAILGNTLPEIAFEKAGIIKKGIPVVIGEKQEKTYSVFLEKSKLENANMYVADENVKVDLLKEDINKLNLNISYLGQLLYPNMELDLAGNYQLRNIKTAIQAIEVMRIIPIEIPDDAIYEGLNKVKQNTGFSGRWEIMASNPLIVCDCAHNTAGLHELFKQVKNIKFNNLWIVTGAVNDKDLQLSLAEFPKEAGYYFCMPDIPRGLDADKLKEIASEFGLKGISFANVDEAIEQACLTAKSDDMILICGSIFVVAEALEYFQQNP